jgi:imidazolonepropionase
MLLIKNIGTLFTGDDYIDDAAILVAGEKIFWAGPKGLCPKVSITKEIDAKNHAVIPGLVDCHSHLIFAGSRADEFALRMEKDSYEAIMAKGGGIMSTVNATRKASDEDLLKLASFRADEILNNGVTTLEAKSGYGLSMKDELRSLKLLKELNDHHDLDIHPTFLGAHVVPKEYANDRAVYVSTVIDMISEVAKRNLAIDCDVFCEKGAFSFDESLKILSCAKDHGFGLRAHVQQLGESQGVKLLSHLPIKSISHADFLQGDDLAILAQSRTVVELLPFACLFLRSAQVTPARTLKDLGVTLAIATDFNPGSAMCHDLILAARLSLSMFHLNIDDVLKAITKNAGSALGKDVGVIKAQSAADIVITNCQSINEIFYDWTKSPIRKVIKHGRVIKG